MASNPYVNKVQLADGSSIIDISGDTITAADVASGKIFHLPSGEAAIGTISDGDLMEYGTEVISDLTGTTWYFNATPDLSNEVLYYINFTASNNSYDGIELYNHNEIDYYKNGTPYKIAYLSSEGWRSNTRTISITGGTDVTNANLIAWMQANAVQQ